MSFLGDISSKLANFIPGWGPAASMGVTALDNTNDANKQNFDQATQDIMTNNQSLMGEQLPMFANGVIIDKPVILTDPKTGKALGMAGENGAETLAPGIKTPNMTTLTDVASGNSGGASAPQQLSITGGVGTSVMGVKNPGAQPVVNQQGGGVDITGGLGLGSINGDKFTNNMSGIREKSFMGMGDFGESMRSLLRVVGYYNDAKRDQFGMGKSPLSRYLDWQDTMDTKAAELDYKNRTLTAKVNKPATGKDRSIATAEGRLLGIHRGTKNELGQTITEGYTSPTVMKTLKNSRPDDYALNVVGDYKATANQQGMERSKTKGDILREAKSIPGLKEDFQKQYTKRNAAALNNAYNTYVSETKKKNGKPIDKNTFFIRQTEDEFNKELS